MEDERGAMPGLLQARLQAARVVLRQFFKANIHFTWSTLGKQAPPKESGEHCQRLCGVFLFHNPPFYFLGWGGQRDSPSPGQDGEGSPGGRCHAGAAPR